MRWICGLVDMQSFYASCEAASLPEFARDRREHDDDSDPPLVVSGDPERRSGIILAATPRAKAAGITTAMRLGEAMRLCPNVVIVRPRMRLYLETSARIGSIIQQMFPLQEQFSIDESFFAIPGNSSLFPDPRQSALLLKHVIWDMFRIRCRVGLAENKWMAKMANKQAKRHPEGVVWWTADDLPTLHALPVQEMWGVRKRADVLVHEFGARTIGDVANIPEGALRDRFGVWGTLIHRFSHGIDESPVDPRAYDVPHKGISHRTTLARDFDREDDIAVVILELLDEVCHRAQSAGQSGRRIGLGLTYARFEGELHKAQTLPISTAEPSTLYAVLLSLLRKHWRGEGVRAVTVSLDQLQTAASVQLDLFRDVSRHKAMTDTMFSIRDRLGETSVMRAVSLLPAGQLRERSRKIGGHYM